MSIEPRAALPIATRMAWPNLDPTDDQSRATKQEQANLCAVTVLCAST